MRSQIRSAVCSDPHHYAKHIDQNSHDLRTNTLPLETIVIRKKIYFLTTKHSCEVRLVKLTRTIPLSHNMYNVN